jgi:hypothetical protein
VFRIIFGPKRDAMAGGWRKLHNDLHSLYSSRNIISLTEIKEDEIGGHVARIGEMKNEHSILVGKPERRRPLGNLGIDGRLILLWMQIGFMWLRTGTAGALL